MTSQNKPFTNCNKEIFIVPSTHWDREWYKPYQTFRFELVKLIDKLLNILTDNDYYFTLDGQTIVLEDYFEIRPENKEKVLEYIRGGKISVGPWYLLPDEWLVGQESLIRNLEVSYDLAKKLQIPLMSVGYLPDQFGHTRAIPQIIADITSLSAAIIWRGVGPEIQTIPFIWKAHKKAHSNILCNYLPLGYGNAAFLMPDLNLLREDIALKVEELRPFSPVPIYLLMNGTDHQFPQEELIKLIPKVEFPNATIYISLLETYITKMIDAIKERNYKLPIYAGEFRSSARAPLLQDTYSSRMWLKLWDNKVEDLLVHYAEPISTIFHLEEITNFPTSYLELAWKWLLRNQPHDSICGCSIDKTHNEMISRYSWAETIAMTIIDESKKIIAEKLSSNEGGQCITFNPNNNSNIPTYIEFDVDIKQSVQKIVTNEGKEYDVQPINSREEIIFENTFKPFFVKTGLKMLPGRKLMDFYINEILIQENVNSTICNVIMICGRECVGEIDIEEFKKRAIKIVEGGKYKEFHVKATLGSKQSYGAMIPLKAWSFNSLTFNQESYNNQTTSIKATKKTVENKFYRINFNKKGSFNLYDKITKSTFKNLHNYEDWGDRGDEYTFSKVGPEFTKMKKVQNKVKSSGPIFAEISQKSELIVFESLNKKRDKRIGKKIIPIRTTFKFYRDIPRIDITTNLTNTAKDHRLRICFNLPFNCNTTITSTHFGHIERKGNPNELKESTEMPSGIQAQKRFIRIENKSSIEGISIYNKGLPEVELVNGSKIALTFLRAVGFLSRQDFPERPMHAGPFLETPGAQELYKDYTYSYSLMTHCKELPLTDTYNHSEAFSLPAKTLSFTLGLDTKKIDAPIIEVFNPSIRISSLRIKDNQMLVLLFNIEEIEVETKLHIKKKFNCYSEILIDGSKKNSSKIKKEDILLVFKPFEIKLISFSESEVL